MLFHQMKQHLSNTPQKHIEQMFELWRSPKPYVFNIETTNDCNMHCRMCPRPTLMTRPVATMDMPLFKRLAEQIDPHPDWLWNEWVLHCIHNYGVLPTEVSENHYFLYVIPKVIILHGYGDPLLDPMIAERVRVLTDRGIPSYFSCNPINVNIDKARDCLDAGLGYIKFSIESTDDDTHKSIRGGGDFTKSRENILRVIEMGYRTQVVVTMLNLNRTGQVDDFAKLQDAFKGTGAYVYLKSEDQQWYDHSQHPNKSIHWGEPCQFPWTSMTINADGTAVSCVEDYNGDMALGDARTDTLREIWNSENYEEFRSRHFSLDKAIRCVDKCDMKLLGEYANS
jgi:radical SAM protein with 4Fe4S-binding SPASM domain